MTNPYPFTTAMKSVIAILLITLNVTSSFGQAWQEIIKNAETRNFRELVQLVEDYYANRDKGKGSGYKQFKRWEYFNQSRLDAFGNVVNVSQYESEQVNAIKRQRSQGRIISSSPGNWQSMGPVETGGNSNGRINCTAVDPAISTTIYAGSPAGGLWRSTDDGKSWNCLTDQLSPLIGVSSIAIDPGSPPSNRTIFIVTGDFDGSNTNYIGVFKSTDNGTSWAKLNMPLVSWGLKLMMHPDNNRVLFFSSTSGLFKSSDGGLTWTQKTSVRFTDFEFHPVNRTIMYGAGSTGAFRSVDSGETWTQVPSAPTGDRTLLSVTPANPAYVYLLMGGGAAVAGIYRSVDHGLTFTKMSQSFKLSGQYYYDLALATSTASAETIYAGEVDLWQSTDGGMNWYRITSGHVDYHSLDIYNGYLYIGNDGGVMRMNISNDAKEFLSSGLNIAQIYKIGHNPHDPPETLIGTQDNGTSEIKNGTASNVLGADGMECFYDPVYQKQTLTMYASFQLGYLFRVEDQEIAGRRFYSINPPGTAGSGAWVTPFGMDPTNSDIIYAAFRDLWKNTFRGANTWVNMTQGITGWINQFAVAPSNNNYIYVASEQIHRTTDGGQSWTAFPHPIKSTSNGLVSAIVIHPENPLVLWVTSGNFFEGIKIFKSTNGGASWTNVSGTLPNVPVNCAVYKKGSANGIYIGNDLGVYYKDDTMGDWVSFDAGMPFAIVNDLEINDVTGKIYAGTYGRGLYTSDLFPGTNPVYATITTPRQGALFAAPATIPIECKAITSEGAIAKVEFYQGSTLLGEDTTVPYQFTWQGATTGNYKLTVKALSTTGKSDTASVKIAVADQVCTAAGKIIQEIWTGIPGRYVSSIPVNTTPTTTSERLSFEALQNMGDSYGSRMRGYVCVPLTGNYTFYIASDDHSELWLSTDANPNNKRKIAYVTGYTGFRQWDKYTTQQSAAIGLEAGKQYYIEALLKEDAKADHLSVGWLLPDASEEKPIPGNRLIPFNTQSNLPPVVSIVSPADEQTFTAPASVAISVNASDSDGTISKVEFYNGAVRLGEDATAPYAYQWAAVPAGNYTIIAKAFDNANASSTASVNISVGSVQACAGTGKITREVWTNITGTSVTSIPVNTTPNIVSDLSIFETPTYDGNYYGSRIRGYLCVPVTGEYVFWIASDDNSELSLSTDEHPANKRVIARVPGYTNPRQWTKYPDQVSVAIMLTAGKRYYIEALHKEGGGNDHVAVGWTLPDGSYERPISGNRLIPFEATENTSPVVSITSPEDGQTFTTPASITISADASDADGNIAKVEFFNGSTKLGEDTTTPYSYQWNNVASGTYVISAKAFDNLNATATSAPVDITVTPCTASGVIYREIWNGIAGTDISSIPFNTQPSSIRTHTSFETPMYVGNEYGSRMRGYICAPVTGTYTFWIASDDNSQLWLSTNDNPQNKQMIASVTGSTALKYWDKYTSQKSAPITLSAGARYYIEALHKEAGGNDHIAVGWQLPDGTYERPIPGNRLSPFESSPAAIEIRDVMMAGAEQDNEIVVFPNPYHEGTVTMTIPYASSGYTNAKIDIVTTTGDVVYSTLASCETDCDRVTFSIDKKLPAGIFLVNAEINNRMFRKKLIVN